MTLETSNTVGPVTPTSRKESRPNEDDLAKDKDKFRARTRKREFLVTLNNGTQADIRTVTAWMGFLRSFRQKHPHEFDALWMLAQGDAAKIGQEAIARLKELEMLSEQGTINKSIQNVLLCAGPDLADPYKAEKITDVLVRAMAEETMDDILRRRIKRLDYDDKATDGERSP